ncbi:MAG: YIP1 family protein [Terracidiphilus sp.]
MSEPGVQITTAGLTQWQRLIFIFTAPSKTFEDIKRGNRSWWLPFLITLLTGTLLWVAIGQMVTWRGVFENNQRNAPEFAKRMMENMPADQKAKQEQRGPISQEITWALAPFGLLLLNVISTALLLATINFGFGGRAKFSEIFAVTQYAGLVVWPIKLLLGAAALYAGALPDAFDPKNPAGTNLAYYLSPQDTPLTLFTLAQNLDPLVIWSIVLTAIGVAVVAGTKRSSGYITVFGWWVLSVVFGVGMAAIFS